MSDPYAPLWVLIPGGTCRYGDHSRPRPVADLLVAVTPLTHQQVRPDVVADAASMPITGVDYAQATRAAAFVGGRLPTSVEWEWIAAGPHRHRYPWGDEPWTPSHALLTSEDQQPTGPQHVGKHPKGATPAGVFDLAGNVWEWTSSKVMGDGYIIRGGSYASTTLYARTTFLNATPAERRSPGLSVRPVRNP